jgi:hypothetical protein
VKRFCERGNECPNYPCSQSSELRVRVLVSTRRTSITSKLVVQQIDISEQHGEDGRVKLALMGLMFSAQYVFVNIIRDETKLNTMS